VENFQALAAQFTAQHPQLKIEIENVTGPIEQVNEKFQAHFIAGTAADVLFIAGRTFRTFAAQKQLLDLEPLARRDIRKQDYYDFALDSLRYNDRLFAFPYDPGVYVVFYNQDLFDKAGLQYPDGTWDWKRYVEVAQRLTVDQSGRRAMESGFDPRQVAQYGSSSPDFVWFMVVYSFGGEVLAADHKKVRLAEPAAVEGLQFIADLRNKVHVAPSPAYPQAQPIGWATGNLAMNMAGGWTVGGQRRQAQQAGFRFDVTSVPRGTQRVTAGWGSGTAIWAQTRVVEPAWTWVRFLGGEHGQRAVMQLGNCAPPAVRKLAESDEFLKDTPPQNKRVFLEESRYSRPWPHIYIADSIEFERRYDEAMAPVYKGERSARDAMAEVAPRLNEVLARSP
jgi:multiple sugar transport system substrate-binding protein